MRIAILAMTEARRGWRCPRLFSAPPLHGLFFNCILIYIAKAISPREDRPAV